MKSKLTFVLLFIFGFSISAFAQNTQAPTTTDTYQPNIRGSLIVAFGLNALNNAPRDFQIRPWNSKSVNIYYLYDIPLGDSRFSFHPGIGLGLEKYQFRNSTIMTYEDAANVPGYDGTGSVLIMDSIRQVFPMDNLRKNRLAANYVDVPLEFSWASNRNNPKAGLKIVVGGKVGFLYQAHTKIKFDRDDEIHNYKLRRGWDMNRFRYSAHTRIGFGAFNVYFEYQFSPLFDNENNGPLHRTLRDNEGENFSAPFVAFPDVRNFRAGIALDLF